MEIIFLGTGTSQGVPIITCDCEVCRSEDTKDKRLRSAIYLAIDGYSFVIDSGPDFRQQMLREDIKKLDALIFTHEHKDHTAGMDDVRSYNFSQQKDMPIYALPRIISQLKQEFAYVFAAKKYPGVPSVEVHELENKPFEVEGIEFIPIEVMHYKLPIFGYRVKDFAYITDAKTIADTEVEKLKGVKTLVINALQHKPHISHFTLEEALEMIEQINPEKAYLTHISHNLGFHKEVQKTLPENVFLAYDGLKIQA
ncbi:MAG: MBL fold metallo-hydrolase [Cytophagales bacterium]|nr:MBL fold metallo-hydrolase [Cytophagales bacterium]